jgi:Zn-finger nucleic acid-binding protein
VTRPACHRELTAVTVAGATVEVCQGGCAGMWFEPGQIGRFEEPTAAAGQALIELTGSAEVHVDRGQRRRCPICPDSVMMRHFFSAKRDVTVDECPTCAGIWLDAGKLQRIRSEFESGEARRRAAHVRLEERPLGQLPDDARASL